jgi:hypothetical protein
LTPSVRKVIQLGIGALIALASQTAQAQDHSRVKPWGWDLVTDPHPEVSPPDSQDGMTTGDPRTAEILASAPPSSSSPPGGGQLESQPGSRPSPEIVSMEVTPESSPPRWELVEPEAATPSNVSSQLAWELLPPGEEFTEARLARELEEDRATQAEAEALAEAAMRPGRPRPWIMGLGGGARIGIGDPTFPMVFGRLGRRLNEDLAISLRPGYIFGNSDSEGNRNNEGAFQMPLTLDFAPDGLFSPFFGLGIATNTDSNGKTEPMVSAGVDLNITPNLSIAASINVVYQSGDEDSRDVEALTVLYFRF